METATAPAPQHMRALQQANRVRLARAELKRQIAGDVVTVGVDGAAAQAAELLDGQPFIRALENRDDAALRLYVDAGETAIPQIMRTLDAAGIELGTIELHRPSLDDVFLTRTGRSLRES